MNILFFLKPKVDLAYLDETCTLRQALEKIKHYGFSAVPVIDAKGKYVGVISEGDLLWEVLERDGGDSKEAKKRRVKDIMGSRQYEPVNVNSDINGLFLKAIEQNFIPVIDDRDMFIGIVTRRDVLRYYYYEEFLKNEVGI
jgi:CBS domain-containing protein